MSSVYGTRSCVETNVWKGMRYLGCRRYAARPIVGPFTVSGLWQTPTRHYQQRSRCGMLAFNLLHTISLLRNHQFVPVFDVVDDVHRAIEMIIIFCQTAGSARMEIDIIECQRLSTKNARTKSTQSPNDRRSVRSSMDAGKYYTYTTNSSIHKYIFSGRSFVHFIFLPLASPSLCRRLMLLTLCHYIEHGVIFFIFRSSFLASHKDRDKIQKQHLNDTVEELKRFNARRKLKGAVQAVSGGVASDPLCGADIDSGRRFCISRSFSVARY